MKISEQKWKTGEQVGLPCNVYDYDGILVCQCKSEATAKAIAGLPELVAAAKGMFSDGDGSDATTRLDKAIALVETEQPDEFMYEELTAENWMQYHGKWVEMSDDGSQWSCLQLCGLDPNDSEWQFLDSDFMCWKKARAKFRRLKVSERIEDPDQLELEPGKWRQTPANSVGTVVRVVDVAFRRLVQDFAEQPQ